MFNQIVSLDSGKFVGTGWIPPMPDMRDYNTATPAVKELTQELKLAKMMSVPLVDLRPFCSQVEDQKQLGSCTAHAAVGIVEYFQRRAYGKNIEGSRLFVYKVTRNLLRLKGDTGAWLRNTMGALVLCGLPDEKYWPYTDVATEFDKEPPSFIYAIADEFKTVKYFCHDPIASKLTGKDVLVSVKKYLEAGIPSMFGFYGFPSFDSGDAKGNIPYPDSKERAEWGHAIVAVGYDDAKEIINTKNGKKTTGALLIRNSWGKAWGINGYGYLPYDYVINKLATDFWSLISMDWVDTKQFGF